MPCPSERSGDILSSDRERAESFRDVAVHAPHSPTDYRIDLCKGPTECMPIDRRQSNPPGHFALTLFVTYIPL